jgi:hypothetical protein
LLDTYNASMTMKFSENTSTYPSHSLSNFNALL